MEGSAGGYDRPDCRAVGGREAVALPDGSFQVARVTRKFPPHRDRSFRIKGPSPAELACFNVILRTRQLPLAAAAAALAADRRCQHAGHWHCHRAPGAGLQRPRPRRLPKPPSRPGVRSGESGSGPGASSIEVAPTGMPLGLGAPVPAASGRGPHPANGTRPCCY